MFNQIPDELKILPQWVNWRYAKQAGKKDTKEPLNPLNGKKAAIDDADTWSTFEIACNNAHNGLCDGIGFVLTAEDEYTFIDLDDAYERQPDGTAKYDDPDTIFARQQAIFAEFKSYAEYSPSGKGLHIICKGRVEAGRRRSAVEVYSDARFMTMTGDVFRNAPIFEEHKLVNAMWSEMGKAVKLDFYDGNAPQREDDQVIIDRALAAVNGDKFNTLLQGDWRGGFPSQSEADLAFINILAFYTQNREQLKRIFRASPLGARNKTTTIRGVHYLDYMIDKSFDRMLPPIDLDGLKNQLEEAIAKQAKGNSAPVETSNVIADIPVPPPTVRAAPVRQASECGPYTVPPGLVGEIAQFIYAAAPRPVPEIALAGALGLMAGICGRAFNVSATGLNQYILLLAPTGRGKEAIHSGISKLMSAVKKTVPAAGEFVGPGEIASPQALVNYLGRVPSFVSVVGEFGKALKSMSDPRAPAHMVGLSRQLLALYNRSGQTSTLEASVFADSQKNTKVVQAPAYSFIGESTLEAFYDCLDDSMVNDGLLPRMTIIEYTGIRPPINENHSSVRPEFRLVEKLAQLCSHAMMLNSQQKACEVKFTADAWQMQKDFNIEVDQRINPGRDGVAKREVVVNLWNRAHIKALKLAATIAVGCNIYDPQIDAEMMEWAIRICVADAQAMSTKFEKGEIGQNTDETKQHSEVRRIVREFVMRPWSEISKYGGSVFMHSERVIPLGYLHRRCAPLSHFKNHRMGSTKALKDCLSSLVETGDLVEVSPQDKTKKGFGAGKCYMIGSLQAFGMIE